MRFLRRILCLSLPASEPLSAVLAFFGRGAEVQGLDTDSLNMTESCFPEAELTTLAFHSGEVRKLLLELDPHGGDGPDGIFPLFLLKLPII